LNAGYGKWDSMPLRGKYRKVTGIDLDERVLRNPDIDVPIVGDIERLTLPANMF
jgi:hypothetical protein